MRMIVAAVTAAVAAVSADEAAARCNVGRFSGNPDAVTAIRMQVNAGERCTVRHMTTRYGRSEQRRFPTTRIALNGGPKNGTVAINGSRVTYAPAKGFRGSDTFSYSTQSAPNKGVSRTYRYQVAVSVD